jgi:hypothetical protein
MFARSVHASTAQVDDLWPEQLPAFASDHPHHGYTQDEVSMLLSSLFPECDHEAFAALVVDGCHNADMNTSEWLLALPLYPLPGDDDSALHEVDDYQQEHRKLQLVEVNSVFDLHLALYNSFYNFIA